MNWLSAWLIAVLVHELSHIAALLACRVRICGIHFDAAGATIETAQITRQKEIICASAGPIGSLLLIFAYKLFPHIAVCALLQFIFNLIPFPEHDGGRILRCLLSFFLSDSAVSRITAFINCAAVGIVFFIIVFFGLRLGCSCVVLIVAVAFLFRPQIQKFLANGKKGLYNKYTESR